MEEYINLDEILSLASKKENCNFVKVPRKRIMFQGAKHNGESVSFCSPQSKMHPQGFYWVDITQEQYRILNEADKGLIIFRLQGKNIVIVEWIELKKYLTFDCIRFNSHEQYHWKLNIYNNHIKISGNKNIMPSKICNYTIT